MFAGVANLGNFFVQTGFSLSRLISHIVSCVILFGVSTIQERGTVISEALDKKKAVVRWTVYILLAIAIIFLSQWMGEGAFVYEQF